MSEQEKELGFLVYSQPRAILFVILELLTEFIPFQALL